MEFDIDPFVAVDFIPAVEPAGPQTGMGDAPAELGDTGTGADPAATLAAVAGVGMLLVMGAWTGRGSLLCSSRTVSMGKEP